MYESSPTEAASKPAEFHCPVCFFSGQASLRYDFVENRIYACPLCGFMFMHPQPTEKELSELYSNRDYFCHESFYSGDNKTIYGYADYFAERMNKQSRYGRIAQKCMHLLTEGLSGNEKKRLLEVGSGPGFFLEEAHKAGFSVEGIEFNPEIIAECRRNHPFPVVCEDYLKIEARPDSYDCIVMLDVLEHFPDPFSAVKKAFTELVPGGVLVISTVDSGSCVSRLLGKRLEDFRRVREHLFFFNRSNIARLLRQQGFLVLSTSSIGHTFILGHLYERLRLMYPTRARVPAFLRSLGERLKNRTISINPRTKMILFAQKPSLAHSRLVSEHIRKDLAHMDGYDNYYRHLMAGVADLVRGKTIMELGCGTGNAMEKLMDMGAWSVTGLDKDGQSIKKARERLDRAGYGDLCRCLVMDTDSERGELSRLIRLNRPDVVFSFNFFEHTMDDLGLVRAIYRSMETGSRLVSIVPAGSRLYNRLDEAYLHHRRYDERDVRLRFAPFSIQRIYRLGFLKGLGWYFLGNRPYKGLAGHLANYNLLFNLDRTIDRAFGNRVPMGATWVLVHEKK